jgi:hypothetical protein
VIQQLSGQADADSLRVAAQMSKRLGKG